jgi:hypothetical protein
MKSLLDEQADMFARFHADAQFLDHDQRAHHMIASLGRLAAEVISSLSMRPGMRMRGTLRVHPGGPPGHDRPERHRDTSCTSSSLGAADWPARVSS